MEQKKLYVTPEETVVEIKMQQHLLAGSGGSGSGDTGDEARPMDFLPDED
jgi:hypothetical protein